jgi:hypothetical protein
MRRILFILAAGFLGLALNAGEAEAKGGHRGGHRGGHGRVHRGYHHSHGHRFSGGYYYRGTHRHWGHRTYSTQYRRYHYWDAGLNCYFYYVPSCGCYYPTSYVYTP